MKILITGSTGFLGKAVIRLITQKKIYILLQEIKIKKIFFAI
jgi:uncharacterized protein YbjT (DUF2867 family)